MVQQSTDSYRRQFLQITGGAVTIGAAALAGCVGDDGGESSSEYPTDEITVIAPGSAGGGYDTYLRSIQPALEDQLGTSVVVENVPGAGGMTGLNRVYNSEPDGHTITMANDFDIMSNYSVGNFIGNPMEMSHIGLLTQTPGAIILSDDTDITTWDDFIDNIDALNMATPGIGTTSHLPMVYLGAATGQYGEDEMNFVHYESTGDMAAGFERGEVNGTFVPLPAAISLAAAVENSSIFTVFSDEETVGPILDEFNLEPLNYLGDVDDVEGLDDFLDISDLRRFITGPPGVQNEIIEIQRDAYDQLIENEDVHEALVEAGRPLINPVDHTAINDRLETLEEVFTSEPLTSILEDAF